ncbi:MAG: nicotinate-nucleotide pyrophosphorylase (carboxylating), partial [Halothiobacillaceae bacterium]
METQIAQEMRAAVSRALAEDVGSGDVTALLIAPESRSRATIISREAAVICGVAWVDEVFRQLDPEINISWQAGDGQRVAPNQRLVALQGRSRALLTGERTALNFLQTLSGTATLAARYAEAVAGLPVNVLDTRKTLPGLRLAQKY